MKSVTLVFIFSILSISFLTAQNDVDALRYSRLFHGGTARYTAMGGAFSALGADFSVLSTNPAGIGLFKNSELVFTPAVYYNSTQSTYNKTMREDFKYNFNISNFGIVLSGNVSSSVNKAEWKNVQFGFGVNRLQNFNNRAIIEGFNKDNTILDVFSSHAQGTHYSKLNPFDTQLAFDTYLLDTAGSSTNYVQAQYGNVLQRKSIATSGGVNEMVMSFGANYNDKLYVGATLGFPFVRYEEFSSYKELDSEGQIPNYQSMTIRNNLETTGSGFQFKFGMIYRIADWVRISGAFHTPTFYSLSDTYDTEIMSVFDTISYVAKSPSGHYDYNLMTPMRAIGGLAFVIAPYGSVSAEYEYVDYAQARLREQDATGIFDVQNEKIAAKYASTGNMRLGTEWIFAPFSFRAGFAFYDTPYKSDLNDDVEQIISAGLGIREKNYFIDFTYTYAMNNQDYYLYSLVPAPAEMSSLRNGFLISCGLKF